MKKLLLLGFAFSAGVIMANAQNTCPGSNNLSYGCQVGRTYYDLQSNASVGNRIVHNSDGTVSVVWLQSKTNVGQPTPVDRGISLYPQV